MTPEVAALRRAAEAIEHSDLDYDDANELRQIIDLIVATLDTTPWPSVSAHDLRVAGWTHQAIADRLGCTESNVRRILKGTDARSHVRTPPRPGTRMLGVHKGINAFHPIFLQNPEHKKDLMRRIRKEHQGGRSLRALADDYGVSHTTIAKWIRSVEDD